MTRRQTIRTQNHIINGKINLQRKPRNSLSKQTYFPFLSYLPSINGRKNTINKKTKRITHSWTHQSIIPFPTRNGQILLLSFFHNQQHATQPEPNMFAPTIWWIVFSLPFRVQSVAGNLSKRNDRARQLSSSGSDSNSS